MEAIYLRFPRIIAGTKSAGFWFIRSGANGGGSAVATPLEAEDTAKRAQPCNRHVARKLTHGAPNQGCA